MKRISPWMMVVALVVLGTGCGAFKNAPQDQITLIGGDLGTACIMIPLQAPEQIPTARLALACAKNLLTEPQIDTNAVAACAEKAGVAPKYRALVALALQRVRAHTGAGPIVPQDSDAGRALTDFFETCSIALA